MTNIVTDIVTDLATGQRRPGRTTMLLWLLAGGGVVAVMAANAHLLYVALTSQPACVIHLRQGEKTAAPGLYRAAKSSCSSTVPTSAEGRER